MTSIVVAANTSVLLSIACVLVNFLLFIVELRGSCFTGCFAKHDLARGSESLAGSAERTTDVYS